MKASSKPMQLSIVSAEESIYSGEAIRLFAPGQIGDLEIMPGHAPLLTALQPGPVRLRRPDGEQIVIYVTGGLLEVQPYEVTVLADTVVRSEDFNESEALRAKQNVSHQLFEKQDEVDYAKARAELARAAGMLKAIRHMKDHQKK